MTRSLNNELLKDEIWGADLYVNKHRCRSILGMARVLSGGQKVDVSVLGLKLKG